MIQIAVYSFVFGAGFRQGKPISEHISYFEWLLAGISVWFFINQSILLGSKSIYTRIRMVSKMSFPMSVIPTFVIITKFYQHLMVLAAVIIILQCTGAYVTIQVLQLPYFMLSTIALMVSLSLITSTLATIVRDVQMIIQSIMRILFYLTPILWPLDMFEHHKWIQTIVMLNPLNYLIEGYRSSLLGYPSWFSIDRYGYTLYFWAMVLILFVLGAWIHTKFRDRFVDFL
jgi:teichoic acid transport system permease protein